MEYPAKFKVDDIVQMKDEFSFNPAYRVVSVGKIQAVHVYCGRGMAKHRQKDGSFKLEDMRGRVIYSVSGFSLMPEEHQLKLYET